MPRTGVVVEIWGKLAFIQAFVLPSPPRPPPTSSGVIIYFVGLFTVLIVAHECINMKDIIDVVSLGGGGEEQVFAVAEARVGAVPLVEPAEEIRALLLRLCCASLAKESARGFGCEVPTVPNTQFLYRMKGVFTHHK